MSLHLLSVSKVVIFIKKSGLVVSGDLEGEMGSCCSIDIVSVMQDE